MLKILKTKLVSYKESENGSFAMTFALLTMIMLFGWAAAIEVANLTKTKQDMQSELDKVLLAAIMEDSSADAKQKARDLYALVELGDYTNLDYKRKNGQIQIDGEIAYNAPTTVAKLLGYENVPISVNSTVMGKRRPDRIKVGITGASGWWSKTATIMGDYKAPDGNLYEIPITSAEYKSAKTYGTASTRVTESGWIDISIFENMYVKFEIDENAPDFDIFCEMDGCPNRIFKSNDPTYSDRQYVAGKRLNKGETIDLLDVLECNKTTVFEWEDGGGGAPDFTYDVRGKCTSDETTDVYVVR